jgi:hypothetical protein
MAKDDKTPKDEDSKTDPDLDIEPKADDAKADDAEDKPEADDAEDKPESKPKPESEEDPMKPEPKPEPEPTDPKPEPTTGDPTGGGTPPSSTSPAPTPAANNDFPWLTVGLIILAGALFIWLFARDSKVDDKADKAVKVALVNNDSIKILDAKKANKTALTALSNRVDKKADKADLAKKLDKAAFDAYKEKIKKARLKHMVFTAKNRELICKFHSYRKECKDLVAKKKKAPKKTSSSGSGKWRSPRWKDSPPASSSGTDPAMASRVKKLENQVGENTRLLKPNKRFEDKVGKKNYQDLSDKAFKALEKSLEKAQASGG